MNEKRYCLNCGKELILKRGKYCLDCMHVKVNCFQCNKEILRYRNDTSDKKYCSKDCFNKSKKGKINSGFHKFQKAARLRQLKQLEGGIRKNCLNCDKEFRVTECRKNKEHCSKKCRLEYLGKLSKERQEKQEKQKHSCEGCNKLINVKRKWCSRECKITYNRIEKKCLTCNNIFVVLPSGKYRKYCSRKCTGIALSKNENRGGKGKFKIPRKKIICPVCNNSFEIPENFNRKYCSKKCYDAKRKSPINFIKAGDKRRAEQIKKRIKKNCLYCNKEMFVPKWNEDRKYCCNEHRLIHVDYYGEGIRGISKIETKFYYYLLESFNEDDVIRQERVHHWLIDFYIKSLDIYIQFDGNYWHSKDKTVEDLIKEDEEQKSDRSKLLLGNKRKDINQNKWFDDRNLKMIRVWESDFWNENFNINNYLDRKI